MEKSNTKSPMGNAVVFIDGNNFYHCLRETSIAPSSIDFCKLSKLVCERFGFKLKKTIYYNSIPDITDGQEMYKNHMKFLGGIKNLPNFEVKTRKLQKMSTAEILKEQKRVLSTLGLCEKCSSIVEQYFVDSIGRIVKREKGIDVMIAVDMLEGAIKNQYDCCILISGDADFVPALNLVKSNGKEARSAFLYNGYSSELRKSQQYFVLGEGLLIEQCLKDKQ